MNSFELVRVHDQLEAVWQELRDVDRLIRCSALVSACGDIRVAQRELLPLIAQAVLKERADGPLVDDGDREYVGD